MQAGISKFSFQIPLLLPLVLGQYVCVSWTNRSEARVPELHVSRLLTSLESNDICAYLQFSRSIRVGGGGGIRANFQILGFVGWFLIRVVDGKLRSFAVGCFAFSVSSANTMPCLCLRGRNGLLTVSARTCSHLVRQTLGGWERSGHAGAEARRPRA